MPRRTSQRDFKEKVGFESSGWEGMAGGIRVMKKVQHVNLTVNDLYQTWLFVGDVWIPFGDTSNCVLINEDLEVKLAASQTYSAFHGDSLVQPF